MPLRVFSRMMALCSSLLLAACAGPGVERYREAKPVLDLSTYFNGTLDAWGMFQDRSGEVTKRFHVVIEGHWEGNQGTLDEHFSWADGSTSRRVWKLTRQTDGSWIGLADDVVGEARGEVAGNALRWRYVLKLPVDGKEYQVDFDDWMYLIDDRVMINQSRMSKFGFHLGQVTLSFLKRTG